MSELLAVDLHRILHEAALFASDDASLPPIHGVQLQSTGKHLIAVGTDRFTLGASSTPYEAIKFQTFVPLSSVWVILKLLKPGRQPTMGTVELISTPKAARLWVTLTDRHKEITKLVVTTRDGGNFPSWKKLFPAKDEGTKADEARVIGFNPEFLAKFGKLSSKYRRALYLLRGPNKASAVKIGDDFVGIIMPVRTDKAETWQLPSWLK